MRRTIPALLALAAAACSYSRVTTPEWTSSTPPATPHAPVLTITASGMEPRVAHLFDPPDLTIVNADDRPHAIYNDRHPAHDQFSNECRMLNVGVLQPGERRVLPAPQHGICFYHDENDPADPAFQGVYIVH